MNIPLLKAVGRMMLHDDKHSTVFLPYNYCIIGCGQAVEDKSSLPEASEETDAEKPKEEPKDKENTGQAKACLGFLILPTKID